MTDIKKEGVKVGIIGAGVGSTCSKEIVQAELACRENPVIIGTGAIGRAADTVRSLKKHEAAMGQAKEEAEAGDFDAKKFERYYDDYMQQGYLLVSRTVNTIQNEVKKAGFDKFGDFFNEINLIHTKQSGLPRAKRDLLQRNLVFFTKYITEQSYKEKAAENAYLEGMETIKKATKKK